MEMEILKRILDENFKNYSLIPNTDSMSGLLIIETPMGERRITINNDRTEGWFLNIETKTDGLETALLQIRSLVKESKEYLLKEWNNKKQ